MGVDSQTLPPFEHIIIDGSTNTGIKDFLSSTQNPPYRKWISEPDKGISDAFNKGINMATGEVIHLQNSGDTYFDRQVLHHVSEAFSRNPNATWLHGKYMQHRGDMWMIAGKPFERKKLYRGMRTIGHQSMFVKKSLYEKYGLFSLNKKIAMDFDFIVRIADEPFIFLPIPLIKFAPGGISNQQVKAGLDEVRASYFQHRGFDLRVILWGWRVLMLDKFTHTAMGKKLFEIKNRNKKK